MTRTVLVAAALATALAACTVGPDYRRPEVPVPVVYALREAGNPAALVDPWWRLFNDTALNDLVAQAFAQNLDLAMADARIGQARAALGSAQAGRGPRVTAGASAQDHRLSENGAQLHNLPPNAQPELEFSVYRGYLDASWELDVWGRQRRLTEAAVARADSAVEARRDAVLRVAAEVARNYADLCVVNARLAAARASVSSLRASLALVEQRVQVGEDAGSDANHLEAEAREVEGTVPLLEAERAAALFAIDVLIGAPPGNAERRIQALGARQSTLEVPPVVPGLPSDLLRRRPDIRRAERELAAETADVGVAVADLYPRFSLTGSGGLEAVHAGDFLKLASRFWQVGPTLAAPVFDGGARRASVQRERAQVDEAVAAYKQAVLRALSDVETALVRVNKERHRVQALTQSHAALSRNLELLRQRLRVGESDRLELLEQERRLLRANDLVEQSRGRLAAYTITLGKSLGGGWQAVDGDERASVQ
ncbi:MAG TPA: efflux transporter outer membrane subunit [Pseudoxanthomonas sp.]|nr:efflux transporter outer membrane subunit [Pseudoxanthomonas sp.]